MTGGGVSTFYFTEAHTGFIADIAGMFTTLVSRFPNGVQWTLENTGDLIDVETGAITGTWTDGSTTVLTGSLSGSYAAGVGARIRWATNGISNKRRVRGSTFLVPLGTTCYATDGSIEAPALLSLQNASGSLLANSDGNMRIYTRPVGGIGGRAHTVVGSTVPDKVSWLRTRRT